MKYNSLGGLTTAIIALIGFQVFLIITMPLFQMFFFRYIYEIMSPQMINVLIPLPSRLGSLALLVVFSIWMYKAAQNVRYFGADDLKYSPGLAAGSCYIPFVNLVLPFLILNEISVATANPESPKTQGFNPLVILTWVSFVLSTLLSTFQFALSMALPWIMQYLYMSFSNVSVIFSALFIISSFFYIVWGVLAVILAVKISRAHKSAAGAKS